ncbi:MAG: FMN-binding protein [Microbacteriaceae bacterium]|nr:FMN-binding protein [Microbacteriaceae bacterium]
MNAVISTTALVAKTDTSIVTSASPASGAVAPDSSASDTVGAGTASTDASGPGAVATDLGTVAPNNDGFSGTSVATRFGNVQAQLVVSSGRIIDVVALRLTDHDRKSVQISIETAPILRTEVPQSQSAQVDTVGGAIATSDTDLTSSQSALDLTKA